VLFEEAFVGLVLGLGLGLGLGLTVLANTILSAPPPVSPLVAQGDVVQQTEVAVGVAVETLASGRVSRVCFYLE
jgi:hypothetical protein